MDEKTMTQMAKAYGDALKGRALPKTRPFPLAATETQRVSDEIATLLKREMTAVEFLLQCAVNADKQKLLVYLRQLLYEVMRYYPEGFPGDPDRYLSPEMAKIKLTEMTVDRLQQTDGLARDDKLYALNSRILALITLI